jgi:hypothetical protein
MTDREIIQTALLELDGIAETAGIDPSRPTTDALQALERLAPNPTETEQSPMSHPMNAEMAGLNHTDLTELDQVVLDLVDDAWYARVKGELIYEADPRLTILVLSAFRFAYECAVADERSTEMADVAMSVAMGLEIIGFGPTGDAG